MNKKLFSVLILCLAVAQPAHAWFECVTDPAKRFVDCAGELARDTYHVAKPEWNTEDRTDYEYEDVWYQLEELFGNKGVATKQTIAELEKKIAAFPGIIKKMNEVWGTKDQTRPLAKSDAQMEELLKSLEDDLKASKKELPRLEKLPMDKVGNLFSTGKKGRRKIEVGDEEEADLGGKAEEGSSKKKVKTKISKGAPPAPELSEKKTHKDSKVTIEKITKGRFVTKENPVTHEDQTAEKSKKMHFFASFYRFRRNTYCHSLGFYPFMKPYALLCAAGLSFGAYKLYKKLDEKFDIYEQFLKPNTGDLEEDELDAKIAQE